MDFFLQISPCVEAMTRNFLCLFSKQITDFGLSKMRGLVEAEQQHVGGTPAFMAPEHTTDSSLQPSTKSDVFR